MRLADADTLDVIYILTGRRTRNDEIRSQDCYRSGE